MSDVVRLVDQREDARQGKYEPGRRPRGLLHMGSWRWPYVEGPSDQYYAATGLRVNVT